MKQALVIECSWCRRPAARVDHAGTVVPAGSWPTNGDRRYRGLLPPGHQAVAVGCDRIDACGWLVELCSHQIRSQVVQGRGRRPLWRPDLDQLRAALVNCLYPDDSEAETYRAGDAAAWLAALGVETDHPEDVHAVRHRVVGGQLSLDEPQIVWRRGSGRHNAR